MPFTNSSANMALPIPAVGIDPGPDYATNVNQCLTIIDSHNHSAGYGVQINPAGININSDLAFNDNNLISARSLRLQIQPSLISGGSDLACFYASGVDAYFNDGAGNQVRLTQNGAVSGTPGSIANLVSPASASYSSSNSTFIFQSAATTPANIDGASFILRNLTPNSKGLTLSPPTAMGADYTIVLPALPGSTSFLTIDTSGNMGATIPISQGIVTSNLANNAVTQAKIDSASLTTPTIQTLLSGSGTYTTPAGVTYIRVRMVSGGGGGAGNSATGVAGSNGSPTTFGTSLLSCSGGLGGGTTSGGVGGTATIAAGPIGMGFSGSSGGCSVNNVNDGPGGNGGASALGGAGGGSNGNTAGPGADNTGSGGGGAGGSGTSGGGGGSGAYIDVIIAAPAATYPYVVGAGGAGGDQTPANHGGSGVIIVEEHYLG